MPIKVLKRRYVLKCNKAGDEKLTAEGGASIRCPKCGATLFYTDTRGKKEFGAHGLTREQVGHECLAVENLE